MAEQRVHVRRHRVEALLDGALTRRLTLVIAPVGAGKSQVVGTWAADVGGVYVPLSSHEADLDLFAQRLVERLSLQIPDMPADLASIVQSHVGAQHDQTARAATLAGLICDAVAGRVRRDLVIAFDDVDLIAGASASVELLNQLILQASVRVHFVLAGQTVPDVPMERLVEQRQVATVDGVDLALDRDEVFLWLATMAGQAATVHVDDVMATTAGWPVAVRAVAERLRTGGDVPALEADLARHAENAVRLLPDVERDVLRQITPLASVCGELCRAIGLGEVGEALHRLAATGLFLHPHPLRADWFQLTALARAGLDPLPDDEAAEVNRVAARWLFLHWHADDGLACLTRARADDEAVELLQAVGDSMVTHGHVDVVLQALEVLPAAPWKDRLAGIAKHAIGEWDEAMVLLERAAGGADRVDPAIAWRIGLTHHQRGDLAQARISYARSDPSKGSAGDHAMAVAWAATVDWLTGDREACAAAADEAFKLAFAAEDARALAAAHTVLALVAALDGDWRANDAHYRRALEHAERAGDVMQRIRIQTNRASLHFERGEYEAALACVDAATRLDDLGGFAPFGALALVNRAEIAVALGQLEEAQADLESAVARYAQIDSRMVGYALGQLGALHHLRGDRAAARKAFEEALEGQRDDVQVLVPALVGLSLVELQEDPDLAREHIAHALDLADSMGAGLAHCAAATISHARGELEGAHIHAWRALVIADERGERAVRAQALTITSRLAEDPEEARRVAQEALRIYTVLGNPVGRAQAELALAARSEPDVARDIAKGVVSQMRDIGCRLVEAEADALLARLDQVDEPPVMIEVLGRGRVLLAGRPVPASAWQSRKARTLLRLLVARRGRVVPRSELSQALWPDDDPARTANRLNVALSTVRLVLDPQRRWPTDHHVVNVGDGLRLDLEHVRVDALEMLSDVEVAEAALRMGREAEATECFARAEGRHGGEAFGDDPYSQWLAPLREEVHVAHLRVLRHLADRAIAAEDRERAVRYLLRILEQEPHDEPAHLQLARIFVAQRRHGEARRRYRLYVQRMREIGVDPAPFPTDPREVVAGP